MHGFASDASDDWVATGWFDCLVAAGYDVCAPDLRGHGKSVKSSDPVDYRLDAFAQDVAALCGHCWGNAELALVGYSMGAHVAMAAALALGARVKRLVLGGMGDRIAAKVGLTPEFADALDARDEARLGTLPSYAVRFRWHAESLPYNDLSVLAACLRGQSARFDLGLLSSFVAPTLVVVGGRDKLAGDPLPVAAAFASGTGAMVPGVGHAEALADPDFRKRALAFLEGAFAPHTTQEVSA
ncbi:alpha/beta fold hydrolase [Bradyrhizobium ottawaense]|uniref:alpha/beta fold hydrolase n=1 Tax=Bradyrhizobium ottawaense TaxID=931866 RepID=UPI003F9F1267